MLKTCKHCAFNHHEHVVEFDFCQKYGRKSSDIRAAHTEPFGGPIDAELPCFVPSLEYRIMSRLIGVFKKESK